MIEIKDNMIPVIAEGIKVRKENFGLIVVSKRTPILTLNEDSTLIWNYIDGESSIFQIIERLNKKIDGNLEENIKIMKLFFENCYKLGLIDFQ